MADDTTDLPRNRRVMDEFRANAGHVRLVTLASDVPPEQLEGLPDPAILILHTTGASSGLPRESPLGYLPVGDAYAVFGSNGARPTNPGWYHNVLADPNATVEVGTETIPVRARVLDGDERERVWTEQKEAQPGFADYEERMDRLVPVVLLEPRG